MFADANARLIFRIARTNLDRIPLTGETTDRDEDVLESPSRTVSDESLLQYINNGQSLITDTVKGQYLTNLIQEYKGALTSFDQTKMARPLDGRVERKDSGGDYQPARFRKIAEHNYLESAGRKATPQSPAYTYDGGKLNVYPGSDPDIRVDYIEYPTELTLSDVPDDTFYKSGSDGLKIDDSLAAPLAMYVTAKASRSIERIGVHDLYISLYERLVRPYRRTWRLGRPDEYGRSRVDEPEVNTEL